MILKVICRSALIGVLALVPVLNGVARAADDSGFMEEIRHYVSVGRIKWRLPKDGSFSFAVPHWTLGPRVLCNFEQKVEATGKAAPPASSDPAGVFAALGMTPPMGYCEIGVFPKDLTLNAEERKTKYFDEMKPYLNDAIESTIQVRSYGASVPISYATLTDKRPNEGWRYVTMGLYVRGPFVIKFHYLTNDATGSDLNRVLSVVHSAEPLDALVVFAWKLSDYKAVCEEGFPELKQTNDAAFSAAMFADVDWLGLWHALNPSVPIEKMSSDFAQAKDDFAKTFRDGPIAEWEAFCRAYPRQVKEAEEAM